MECTNIFRMFLLLFITGYCGIIAVEISVDFNSQHAVRAGTNVTYTCRAVVPDEQDPLDVTLGISKVAEDKSQTVFAGAGLFGIYRNLERYQAKRYVEGQVIIAEININSVQEEDSGEYRCLDAQELGNAESSSLTVFSDIDRVDILYVDHVITAHPDEEFNITCYVTSSIPEAQARIYVDDYDYTDKFHKSAIANVKNDETSGVMQPLYIDYDTVYRSVAFKPLPEHDGKELICEAQVLGNKGFFPPQTATLPLEIFYEPIFFDCKEQQYALLHQEGVRVNCSVRYNPMGSANWTFVWGGSQVTLGPEDSTQDLEITARQMRVVEGSNVHVVFLEINKVYERHFQKYTLKATNKYDTNTIEITLKEGKEPSGSSCVLSSVLITVTAAFFARLLWL